MLSGITVGVKDIIVTQDFPTRFGTTIPQSAFADLLAIGDAQCVARLRHAGACISGKTVTTELATFHPGPTRNPWQADRTPGGSSSGSAAAVAAGDVSLALATQTAGSISRPAAYCGVLGLKPTFGRLNTKGILCTSRTLDTLGFMARSVSVLRQAMATLGELNEIPAAARDQTLVFYPSDLWPEIDPDSQFEIERFVTQLSSYFKGVKQKSAASDLVNLAEAQRTIHSIEVSEHLGHLTRTHDMHLSPAFKAFVRKGAAFSSADSQWAYRQVAQVRQGNADLIRADEIWLTPVTRSPAPPIAEGTGDPEFCCAWTASGNPTLTVPIAIRGNLPIGVQLIAAQGADETLITVAAEIEHLLQKPWEVQHET